MKRSILIAFAVASLGLITMHASHAEAAWVGSGWWAPGTWRNFSLSGSNGTTFAVSTPFTDAGVTISGNITTNTWHWAATLCSNGVQNLGFIHPWTGSIAGPTFAVTVGGWPNHNKTKLCSGSSQSSGGAYLWQ